MSIINVYCGWYRDAIITMKSRIVDDIVFEMPCRDCDGTGIYDGSPEGPWMCNLCKGSGKEYVGL